MRIKKLFILLLTSYAVGGIMIGVNYSPMIIFLFSMLICTTCFILKKDTAAYLKTKIVVSIIYLIIFVFFIIYSKLVFNNISRNFSDENRQKIELTGYISEIRKNEDNKFKFIIKADNGYRYNIVTDCSDLLIGDVLKISGILYKPEPAGNKGEFDYLRYSYSKNISADIYSSNTDIVKTGTMSLYTYIGKIRTFAVNRVMNNLDENDRGIVTALITGSYEYIEEETSQIFQKSGLSHIFSISGTHFSILILPLYAFFSIFSKNKRISIVITIILIIILLLFTGVKISAVRSALCMITFLICRFFFLDTNRFLPICASILIILFINPLSLFDTGFIMSYGCIISIQLFNQRLKHIFFSLLKKSDNMLYNKVLSRNIVLEDYYRRIKKSFVNTVLKKNISYMSLIISIQPLIIFITYKLFQCIYPYSLITNILSFIIISPMLISLWLGIFSPELFCPIFNIFLNILLRIASFISSLPNSKYFVSNIPNTIFIIVIITYMLIKSEIIKVNIMKKYICLGASLLCILIMLINSVTKAVFIDVGQGDCALITTFFGYNILIDTGKSVESSCIAYYTGNHIDTVILTHADNDHCGAISQILEEFKVDKVCLPYSDDIKNMNLYNEIKSVYPSVKVELLKRGNFINEKGIYIRILNPDSNKKYKDTNESGIVFSLLTNSCTILFTADANLNTIPHDSYIKSDIIKMPHHGDSSAINETALRHISAYTGIISVGKYNSYGHPEKDTLDIMKKLKMNILRTDTNGSITIYMLNKKYYVFKYR